MSQPTTSTTATSTSTLFVESAPTFSYEAPHESFVRDLLVLSDGSIVSCSSDKTAKRWLIDNTEDNKTIRLVGTYLGHTSFVTGVVEIYNNDKNNTFLTGSFDKTLREWNKTTCECLRSSSTPESVCCLAITKDKLRIVIGMWNGGIEIRRADDLGVISTFRQNYGAVTTICELADGSFVSGSNGTKLRRFDENGTVLQIFSEYMNMITKVMELDSDTIIAACSDATVGIWKLSTGQLIHKIRGSVQGLIKLSDDRFVTGSSDKMIQVWNGTKGECIEAISTCNRINAITRIGDSIVTANPDRMEVRRLKYDSSRYIHHTSHLISSHISSHHFLPSFLPSFF